MLKGITVALDCAHGATSQIAPEIFTSLGATVHLTGVEPNGFNINHKHGSTVPETIHTLTQHTNADYGCSFDGDGDRVTIVTQDGVIHTGDHLLPLLVTHPRFTDQTAVVGTIMSNKGVELWLEEQGYHLLRTPVGDSHVFHAMKETNLALGGEPSGHIIVRPHLPSSDGIFTALLSIQTGLLTNNKLLKSCTLLPQATINIPITSQQDLTREPYASIIRTHLNQVTQDDVSCVTQEQSRFFEL